jgi:hypothetical protein
MRWPGRDNCPVFGLVGNMERCPLDRLRAGRSGGQVAQSEPQPHPPPGGREVPADVVGPDTFRSEDSARLAVPASSVSPGYGGLPHTSVHSEQPPLQSYGETVPDLELPQPSAGRQVSGKRAPLPRRAGGYDIEGPSGPTQ